MRRSVDFPQPEGADEHHELAVGGVQVDALHREVAVGIALDGAANF
jgi:hypothetical protein